MNKNVLKNYVKIELNDLKLEYWALNGMIVLDLGKHTNRSKKMAANIRLKFSQYDVNFSDCIICRDNRKRPTRHYLIIHNGIFKDVFVFLDIARQITSCFKIQIFYWFDRNRNAIYKVSYNYIKFIDIFSITRLYEILNYKKKYQLYFYCPKGYKGKEYAHLSNSLNNDAVKLYTDFISQISDNNITSKDYTIIETQEQLMKHYNYLQNAYEFYSPVKICIDIDDINVNIIGTTIIAQSLKVRNITCKFGIMARDIECKTLLSDFIIVTRSISTEKIFSKILKTLNSIHRI